jgi:5'-phosphate synthase pdxT subunit
MVGILALQGDVREHLVILERLGVDAMEVRTEKDLSRVDGLILPGGESTTISNLLRRHGLDKALVREAKRGLPLFGTCAGAILLANQVVGEDLVPLGLMDIAVRRNAYGPQAESFEEDVEIKGIGTVFACFIRAPIIENIGEDVEVLAEVRGRPVLVRQGNLLAATFHPELVGETRVHEFFLQMVAAHRVAKGRVTSVRSSRPAPGTRASPIRAPRTS